MPSPLAGFQSAAQFHLAEKHSDGPLEEKDIMAAMETAQTQRPGLSTLSLEEQRILLSLDRLNQQLHGEHRTQAGRISPESIHLIAVFWTKYKFITVLPQANPVYLCSSLQVFRSMLGVLPPCVAMYTLMYPQ